MPEARKFRSASSTGGIARECLVRCLGRKALEPGRGDLALALLSWLDVFGLICAVIAESFRYAALYPTHMTAFPPHHTSGSAGRLRDQGWAEAARSQIRDSPCIGAGSQRSRSKFLFVPPTRSRRQAEPTQRVDATSRIAQWQDIPNLVRRGDSHHHRPTYVKIDKPHPPCCQ